MSPGEPEWNEVADRLSEFMSKMSAGDARRPAADELSFKKFCFVAVQSIAEVLGYTVKNIEEFVRDMGYAVQQGWHRGIDRARASWLRP